MKVAAAVQPAVLDTGDLDDLKGCSGSADIDQRLDLEPIAPPHLRGVGDCHVVAVIQTEYRQATAPESVVAVAEVGVFCAAQRVDEQVQDLVPGSAKPSDVMAATARGTNLEPLAKSAPDSTSVPTNRGFLRDAWSRQHPS